MKTFMLVGDTTDNAGPSNVHRELIAHWPDGEELLLPNWSSAASKLSSTIACALRCDALLTTGSGRLGAIAGAIARRRGVPVVVLVHGYLPYENEVNGLGLSGDEVRRWCEVLRGADIVATNSEFHARCLREAEPGLADIVRWFNLGIEPFTQRDHVTGEGSIRVAVSGGTRPIKGNEVVARACSLLQDQGHAVDLAVYGRSYSANAALEEGVRRCNGRMMGQVSQDEFLDALTCTDVFVMDSRRESFGLSAIDALRGGASLLISCNCGVAGVLALEEGDVVSDCEDAAEIAREILNLAAHPNSRRLYEALSFDALSWDVAAARLCEICHEATAATIR